jgi:ketosteroid isomerase-like protein
MAYSGMTTMDIQATKQAALRFLKNMERGYVDPDMVTADFSVWSPGFPELTAQEYAISVRGVISLMRDEKLEFSVDNITAEADRVAIEVSAKAALPDGSPYQQHYHFLAVFHDGRLSKWKEYMNAKYAIEALFGAYLLKFRQGQR